MGYYRANFARWPGWEIQVQAVAGRASRAVRGFSQAVATSRVSTVIEQSLTGAPEHGLGSLTLDALPKLACFHCGEPCPDPNLTRDDKAFCCRGCLFVHDLLAGSGLEQFYDLSRHPGVRVRRPAKREQWAYLDDPAFQQQLLDFTDGKVSRVTFQVPAIHCVACVWLLENLFRLQPGIGRSQVNFPRR
jgi:hypothetical protein